MERIDEDVKELANRISAGTIAPVDTPVEEPKEEEDPSLTRQALGFVPGVGTALDVADVAKDVERGDYVGAGIGAAVTALGLIPGAGRLAGNALKAATKAFRKTDASDAQKLIDDPKLLEEWKAKQTPAPQKNLPVTEKAAEDLYQGDITSKEFREIVKKELPITSMYTQENFPDMPTVTDIAGALGKNASKGVLGVKGFDIPQGKTVGARLDIPAYNRYNKWVVSIHDGDEDLGLVMGYGQAIKLKDVRFSSKPGTALDIARRKVTKQKKVDPDTGKVIKPEQRMPKSTIARAIGKYQKEDPYKLQQEAYNLINDPEWTQVGMNPYRASYFYDKATGKPVFNAKEVIQIGPLVLAKGIKKPTLSEMKKFFKTTPARTKDGRILAMNKGGDIMEKQMEMAFMNEGGVLKDDGMNKDPVSGNKVPSGSMAKEVRDDIPAQLSEGEYVVPADVVRFHGVQKFEDLRNQAKQGFGRMEKDGRIGGEPVDDSFPIPLDQLQTYDEGGDVKDSYQEVFGKKYTPGQRYGTEFAPTGTGFELVTYTSPDGQRTIVIPHYNGKPMSRVPSGFTPKTDVGTGGGSFDPQADERDRQERENEAQQKKNMAQPVTIDPLMQAQLDQDRKLSEPTAPEDFTPNDFINYYNQTQSVGLDDVARNIPILGGLLARQDKIIRDKAEKILTEGTQTLTEEQFNAMNNLLNTAPQQGFLSSIFGQKEYKVPDAIKGLTYKDYKSKQATTDIGLDMQSQYEKESGIGIPDTVTTAEDLKNVNPNKPLSTTEVNNVIKNLGQDSIVTGGIADTLTKTMLGITGGNKIMTPKALKDGTGPQEATAGQLKGIIDNAQNIQTTLVGGTDPSTGEKKESIITDPQSYGIDKPIGSGPPSVTEIFNAIHGNISQDYSSSDIGGISSAPPDIGNPGGIMMNKGALVTKPKRKVAPKKRTTKKGLGVKTKAT